MIIITDIKTIEVSGTRHDLYRMDPTEVVCFKEYEPITARRVATEHIKGRCFIKHDGTEVWIGVSGEASRILGMEFKRWESMRSVADDIKSELNKFMSRHFDLEKKNRKMDSYIHVGFWRRLMRLFSKPPGFD